MTDSITNAADVLSGAYEAEDRQHWSLECWSVDLGVTGRATKQLEHLLRVIAYDGDNYAHFSPENHVARIIASASALADRLEKRPIWNTK